MTQAGQAEDDEEVLFEADVNGKQQCGDSHSEDGCPDDNQILFDAEASSGTSPSDEHEEFVEDGKDGVLGPPPGMPLPVMGSTSWPFNAQNAADFACKQASKGASSPVPPSLRRLMWLRWLGVVRGKCPSDWVQELQAHREEFNKHLEEAQRFHPQDAKLRKLIRLDVARCFAEVPRLRCGAARLALRNLLEVHLRRCEARGRQQAYCQGYHELAAVMLLACMDGTWPDDPQQVEEELSKMKLAEDDITVYKELCSAEAVPADALALLEALLYEHRLVDMYEPKPEGDDDEAAVALRCRKIMTALRPISADVADKVESWGLSPHVLLLRWVRLLFLRELKFPNDVLVAWDAFFADAYMINSDEKAPAAGVLPSSAALPLCDDFARAMILAMSPSNPEQLLHYSDRSPNVNQLLHLAHQLRVYQSNGTWNSANKMQSPTPATEGSFPQPPAACYPKLTGLQKLSVPPKEKDRRYTMGDSLGGEVFGHALGWAASRLSGALEGVLKAEAVPRTKDIEPAVAPVPDRTGRRSSEPVRPTIVPPSPEFTALQRPRRDSFPAEKELADNSAEGADEAQKPPNAPIPGHRKPRERGNSEETDASFWPLSPALSGISATSLSQPRFKGLFSASPLQAPRIPHVVAQADESTQLRSLLPFPKASKPAPAPVSTNATSTPAEPSESDPFWAPLPEQEAESKARPKLHEPSAEGVMKDLDDLQAMLHSLGQPGNLTKADVDT